MLLRKEVELSTRGERAKRREDVSSIVFPLFLLSVESSGSLQIWPSSGTQNSRLFLLPYLERNNLISYLETHTHRKKSNIKHVSIKEEEAVVFFPFAWQRRSKKHFGVSSPVTYQKAQYSTTLVSVWFYPIGYWHVLHFCHNHNLGKTCWWG